jgi:hypothetical protein
MGAQCSSNNGSGCKPCSRFGGFGSGEGGEEIGDLANLGMDSSYVRQSVLESEVDQLVDCNLQPGDTKAGDHVCPMTDREAADTFHKQGVLEKVLAECKELLMDIFDLCEEDIRGMGGLVCAVSQPSKEDCPLIYVSDGFEKLTGYPGTFALGRSCRFLQPNSATLNDAINLKDRKGLREFCANFTKFSNGDDIVNLLMNERHDGPRFWNLLKMAYVEYEGEKYIFAVQTPLGAYMPKALRGRIESPQKNQEIVKALPVFAKRLNELRDGLAERTGESIYELAAFASGFLDSMDRANKPTSGRNGGVSAMQSMSAKVGGRKSAAAPGVKSDKLCVRFQSVKGMTSPVPNKCIEITAGSGVMVNVDNPSQTAVFAALSGDQFQKCRPVSICLDVVPRAGGAPMLMCTVKTAMADQTGVVIDDVQCMPGTTKPVQVGSLIEVGGEFVLRVASLKSALQRVNSK